MVDLAEFRVDTKAINDGVWIRVDEQDYQDLEILSRGFVDDFVDAQNARMAKAAEAYGGDKTRIPNSVMRQVNATLLEDFLVIDVRNLTANGEPVKVADFHAMLYDPAFSKLARASWLASSRVTTRSATQLAAASGNSPAPWTPGSPGATSEPS